MKFFVIFLVIFAVTKASLFDSNFLTEDDDAPDRQVNFLSVNSLADFVAENPEAELEMMHMYSDYRGQINYVLGARQRGIVRHLKPLKSQRGVLKVLIYCRRSSGWDCIKWPPLASSSEC